MARKETVPTWGYSRGESGEIIARLFDLPTGKPTLPRGWADSPARVAEPKPARKAAVSRGPSGT